MSLDETADRNDTPIGAPKARKRGLLVLGAAVLLGGGAYAAWELLSPPSESTDDAYVAGDVVAITAREPGTVIALHADNTQAVQRNQMLIAFDPAIADATMASAEAQLARTVRMVRADFSRVDEAAAEIVRAEADLARANADLDRRQQAAGAGAVSGEDVAHAADGVRAATATLALARSRQAQARAAVQGTRVETHPDVLAAIAAMRRAAIGQNHMRLTAPVDGVLAQRSVQLGQHVAAGAPLMAVVGLDRLWVDANFRETQLADMRVGQPATIVSDIYGGKVTVHGHVLGLGAGSGNAFALLPPQNASGNWIKIVQRLPVRIALDPAELRKNPLRIGLSVTVTVDTKDHSGEAVARAAPAQPFAAEASQGSGPAVETRIAQIIAENRGDGAR
jgi:membrane fusion protein (multidrug efflux system)